MPETQSRPSSAAREDAVVAKDAEIAELQRQLEYWRGRAIVGWSQDATSSGADGRLADLERELAAVRSTLSWRVTAPLRAVSGLLGRVRGVVSTVRGR